MHAAQVILLTLFTGWASGGVEVGFIQTARVRGKLFQRAMKLFDHDTGSCEGGLGCRVHPAI
ncbi:hypothetical protein A6E19_24545 [Pseudomonas putida]|nr:hypothetical protein A6E20_24480 [Pseudomonas putida]OCT33101.1 hypothetical protein A6E23_24430 [Pseudomonas putida]OCT34865.1 hypothetical protein A6E24_24400 [Pseudomonas putida]OCT41327.1 hypothetical protein A6E19_24545 [Pseudomonas putida]